MLILKSNSPLSSSSSSYSHFFNLSSFSKLNSPSSSSLLFLSHHHVHHPTRQHSKASNFTIRAYMETPNSFATIASKVIGALPVVGLIARILSDEGGVGGDLVDFAEFRRRVGKNCNGNDSTAFYQFQYRRGRTGDPIYVLLCCWLAAIGAGLLKTEEILEGVARLRISNDVEFEEQTFIAMMTEAREVGFHIIVYDFVNLRYPSLKAIQFQYHVAFEGGNYIS